jgi:mycoredoxin
VSVKPIVIIGADWCEDCRQARQFLDTYDIPYQWIDIDVDKNAEQIVLEINQGFRSIPTILFEDGSTLVEPTNFDLITKLDLMN